MRTHGVMIPLEDGSVAFIDGIPDTCKHEQVDDVFQAASGKLIFWHTYRQWASMTSEMRNNNIYEYHNEIEDPIVMGTCQCRKCKKIIFPNSIDFQF